MGRPLPQQKKKVWSRTLLTIFIFTRYFNIPTTPTVTELVEGAIILELNNTVTIDLVTVNKVTAVLESPVTHSTVDTTQDV